MNNEDMKKVREYYFALDNLNSKLMDLINARREVIKIKSNEEEFDKIIDVIMNDADLKNELLRKNDELNNLTRIIEVEARKYK